LLLILVVALLVRLPGLDRDLWYDEALSLFHARGANALMKIIPNGPVLTSDQFTTDRGWHETVTAIAQIEQTPPLYFFLLRLWRKIFGERNGVLRLLSLIMGLTSLLAAYLVGRQIANAKVGVIAAGVLALLPLHIQYSQEIRAYMLAFLLVLLSTWAFLRASSVAESLHKPSKWWFLYGGLIVLSLYTHYFTLGTFMAHALSALTRSRTVRRVLVTRILVVALIALSLLTPWFLLQYVSQFRAANLLHPRVEPPGFWELGTVKRLASLICHFVVGWLPGMTFASALGLSVLAFYGVTAHVLGSIARRHETQSALLFGSLLFLMPLFFVIAVEMILNDSGLLLFPRFALTALIGLCLLCAVAIVYSNRRIISFFIVVLLLAFTGYFQVQWHRIRTSPLPPPGLPWFYGNLSSAVIKVSEQVDSNELLLFDDLHLVVTWNVYEKSRIPQLLMTRKDFFYLNRARDFDARWREIHRTYPRISLVRRVGEPPSEIMNRLDTSCRLLAVQQVGRLEIRRYANQPPEIPHHPLQEGRGPAP